MHGRLPPVCWTSTRGPSTDKRHGTPSVIPSRDCFPAAAAAAAVYYVIVITITSGGGSYRKKKKTRRRRKKVWPPPPGVDCARCSGEYENGRRAGTATLKRTGGLVKSEGVVLVVFIYIYIYTRTAGREDVPVDQSSRGVFPTYPRTYVHTHAHFVRTAGRGGAGRAWTAY